MSVNENELYEEPENNAEEQYCHLALAELRKSYELAAKPYIDRLVAIKSLRMPVIRLSQEQLDNWAAHQRPVEE